MLDLDALRAVLGFGPTDGEAWFHLSEQVVGFAPQKIGNRAILLRNWGTGPVATVFARTTSKSPPEPINPAHVHQSEFPKCWLRKDAWIITRRPIALDKDLLNDESRICTEDDTGTITAVMGQS